MKIVFFGTPEFAVESLREIHENSPHEVAAVVTATDKPAGRGHANRMSAVKQYALEHGLEVLQPEKLRDESFLTRLREINADLFVVIAFRMMPEVVWNMPPKGTFNLHASLLPRYRGAAPINWAVINGDKVTGVTTFFLRHDIDTGPVIARKSIEIGENENVGSVYDRLMKLGATLTMESLDAIALGNVTPVDQSQLDSEPAPAPKIFTETCRIDWTRSAREIHNLVRGLSPYPCAWTTMPQYDDTQIKILETRVLGEGESASKGGWPVECGHDTRLEILQVKPAGKKAMRASDYLRGLRNEALPVLK